MIKSGREAEWMVRRMLNEDRIKLMTGIGMFEKKEGRRIFPVCRYFRSDYISKYMLRSFLGFTFCWALGTALVVLYKAEDFLASVNFNEIAGYGKMYIGAYLMGLAVYLLITCIVYWRRYEYASRGMKVYVAKLKRLEKRYEMQGKNGQGGRRL